MYKLKSKGLKMQPICILKYFIRSHHSPKWYQNYSWIAISSKKTKNTIFEKRAKKNSDLEFHIEKQTIDIVHKYTYQGARISSTGNFNVSLEH